MAETKNDPNKSGGGSPSSSSSSSSSSGSSTTYRNEQPVMASRAGVDIRKLLGGASGKEFDDMTSKDFEDFAASKGVVRKDVRKLSRAFETVKKNSARQWLVDTDGFNVIQDNMPMSMSGRDKGNKRGLDFGDLVGLGNNLSLLAGFASRELTNYRKSQDQEQAKQLATPIPGQAPAVAATPTAPAKMSASNLLRRPSGTTAATKQSSSPARGNSILTQQPATGYPNMWGQMPTGQKAQPQKSGGSNSTLAQTASGTSPQSTWLQGLISDIATTFNDQVITPFSEAGPGQKPRKSESAKPPAAKRNGGNGGNGLNLLGQAAQGTSPLISFDPDSILPKTREKFNQQYVEPARAERNGSNTPKSAKKTSSIVTTPARSDAPDNLRLSTSERDFLMSRAKARDKQKSKKASTNGSGINDFFKSK